MSCNSLIDVATTTSTSVLANGVIPFDTIVRRRGKEVQQSQRQRRNTQFVFLGNSKDLQ